MKVLGSIQTTKNIEVGKNVIHNIITPTLIIDPSPSINNKVLLDLSLSNHFFVDLSTSTTDIIDIEFSNPNVSEYTITFKQHGTSVRDLNFNPIVSNNKFKLIQIGIGYQAVMALNYDGTNYNTQTNTSCLTEFDENINYGVGVLVAKDNVIYISKDQVDSKPFDINDWYVIGNRESYLVNYTDNNAIGETNVQSAIDYLTSKRNLESKTYDDVQSFLLEQADHIINAVYLVKDATDDSRTTGYAYYQLLDTKTGNITDYRIVSQETIHADKVLFDNAVAQIDGNPTEVQKAIENLNNRVSGIADGVTFIDNWNANTNNRFLVDGGKYDSLTNNSTVSFVDVINNKITVLSSDIESANLNVGDKIKIVAGATNITSFDVLTIEFSGSNTIIGVNDVTGVLIGHSFITADKKANSGQYFIVDTNGSTELDGVTEWTINDRVISNGDSWVRIHTATSNVLARDVTVDTENNIYTGDLNNEATLQNIIEEMSTLSQNKDNKIDALEVKNVTFDELRTLIDTQTLVPQKNYLITDYRTVYQQEDGTISESQTGINDNIRGELEPLMVRASTNSLLFKQAVSLVHDDIILYDPTKTTLTNGGDTFTTKGVITYRKDLIKDVSCTYDFRNIKFKRYALPQSFLVYSPTQPYSKGDIVHDDSGSWYVCRSINSVTGVALNDQNVWVQIFFDYSIKFMTQTNPTQYSQLLTFTDYNNTENCEIIGDNIVFFFSCKNSYINGNKLTFDSCENANIYDSNDSYLGTVRNINKARFSRCLFFTDNLTIISNDLIYFNELNVFNNMFDIKVDKGTNFLNFVCVGDLDNIKFLNIDTWSADILEENGIMGVEFEHLEKDSGKNITTDTYIRTFLQNTKVKFYFDFIFDSRPISMSEFVFNRTCKVIGSGNAKQNVKFKDVANNIIIDIDSLSNNDKIDRFFTDTNNDTTKGFYDEITSQGIEITKEITFNKNE